MNRNQLDISIIIVNYNTKNMTLSCLKSIYSTTSNVQFEIIVIDNNSEDGSVESIRSLFPSVKLISAKDNHGFAKANNIAAESTNGEYLLLLNPDTIVLSNALYNLHSFANNNPTNLIYGGRTLFGDYSLNPTSCWARPTLWSLFCYAVGLSSLFRSSKIFSPETYGTWDRNSARNVDIVTGCFLLIPKSFWNDLRGFDTDYFMYGEDFDLCLRGKKLGAKPSITPEATIIHHGGASEPIRSEMLIRLFSSKLLLLKKHWHPAAQKIGEKMIISSVFIRSVICTFLKCLGMKKYKDRSECWCNVWKRRTEWLNP